MEQLQALLNEKFEKMVSDGVIEKMIEDKLASCMNEVFTSATRSCGALTKHFETQIEEAAQQGMFNLDLESYNDVIGSLVKQKLSEHFKGAAQAQIISSLDEMLKPIPKEITMQEMVDLVQAAYKADDYDGDNDEYLSMECTESEYGWFDLKFWKKKMEHSHISSDRERSPDIQLHVDKNGRIRWLKSSRADYGAHNHNVESTFYRMTMLETKITDITQCDQDDFQNTYIGLGEDY